MNQPKLKLDLKKLANSELVANLSKHLTTYEKRVKGLVSEFDLKSRDARQKGQEQIDKLAGQFKRSRNELEKRVSSLLHQEGQRLNQGVNDLFNYLKSIAKSEKLGKKSAAPTKKKASKGDASSATKKNATRKPRGRKESHVAASATGTAASPAGA